MVDAEKFVSLRRTVLDVQMHRANTKRLQDKLVATLEFHEPIDHQAVFVPEFCVFCRSAFLELINTIPGSDIVQRNLITVIIMMSSWSIMMSSWSINKKTQTQISALTVSV